MRCGGIIVRKDGLAMVAEAECSETAGWKWVKVVLRSKSTSRSRCSWQNEASLTAVAEAAYV